MANDVNRKKRDREREKQMTDIEKVTNKTTFKIDTLKNQIEKELSNAVVDELLRVNTRGGNRNNSSIIKELKDLSYNTLKDNIHNSSIKFSPEFNTISMTTFNDRDPNNSTFMTRNSQYKKYYVKHPHENERVLFPKVDDMNSIKVYSRNVSPLPQYNSNRLLTPMKVDPLPYNNNNNANLTNT